MKKASKEKISVLEKLPQKLWGGLRTVSAKIVRFSFWEMAFLAFLLRLLVAPPFGAALALAVSGLWLYKNFAAAKDVVIKALASLTELSEEEQMLRVRNSSALW